MKLSEIFEDVERASGSQKLKILEYHRNNELLRDVLKATYEPTWTYNVTSNECNFDELNDSATVASDIAWRGFLDVLNACNERKLRGNQARKAIIAIVETADECERKWMKRVLDRHLNVGISTKTINRVWRSLITTFECQLAHQYDPERVNNIDYVAVEPKLDGVRCLAFVDGANVMLFTRSGKRIVNFQSTVEAELIKLTAGANYVFDGELMSHDFSMMMGQVFRKKNVDPTCVTYHVFDWLPRPQWDARKPEFTNQEAREFLEDMAINANCKHVRLIERRIVRPDALDDVHKQFVERGYEGSMIKIPFAKYAWKRTWNVMKRKDVFTVDCKIVGFTEGSGRYRGHLGSFIVNYNGKRVNIERGNMNKDEAREIWENRTKYRGMTIEVGYQEVTRDGSLRFPKFIRFRRDK